MKGQPIRHFTDLEGGVSRRTVLKGMFRSAAAGFLLPYNGLERQMAQSESLQDAVNRIGKKDTGDERFWGIVKKQFMIREGLIMLNAANLCPSPLSVQKRLFELTKDVDSDPSFTNRSKYGGMKEEVRKGIAKYVNADRDEIALVRNTSEGNNIVINGLQLDVGDEVVIWDQNHPTANVAWDVRAQRYGYRVIRVQTPQNPTNTEDLMRPFIQAITNRTKVLCFSHVSNVSGIRLPAEELCQLARSKGILTLVDGAQTFGTYPLFLHDIGCDFYTASSHKWFCGPRELGVLYVRRGMADSVFPSIVGVGWESARASGAKKFETLGQQAVARFGAMLEAIKFHETLWFLRISSRARMLADAVREGVKKRIPSAKFITPMEHQRSWGVVIFHIPGVDTSRVLETLYHEYNVGCAVMGANIRFSPHFYNTLEDIDKAVHAVARISSGSSARFPSKTGYTVVRESPAAYYS
jgi:selenocysteine lyase/cysteine desulfurase